MNTWIRRVLIGVAAVCAGSAVALSVPANASGDSFDEGLNCAVLNGVSCVHVSDARNWAESVTTWKFGAVNHHNDMGDAFRHCAWIGALATRIGQQDAYRVGFVHEEYDKDAPEAEKMMDDWNNYIGAGIGADAVASGTSDQWGYVLDQCESRARDRTLYGLGGLQGNYSD